jgi:transcriptional regulator with XRE-family HTH domain
MRYMPDAPRGIAYPLYQRVNRELALRGWTHVELQRKSGVARSTVAKWATGQQPPMPDRVNAVADALGIDRAEALRLAGILTEIPARPHRPLFSDEELDTLEAELGIPLDRLDPETRRIWLSLLNAALKKAERDREEYDRSQRRGA